MKKQLFLMSALALTTLATVTSCGPKGNQPYTPGNKIKVGLICLHTDSTYDKNFQNAFREAMDEAKEKGYVSSYEIKTDVPEEGRDCYDAAEQFVNSGCNVIFSDSFGHDVSMHEAAEDFKNVQFSSATGIEARKSGLTNFHNAFASIYEGRYLEGVVAGLYMQKHSLSHTIGYVGAFPYAEVISGYTSWYLGVKSIITDVQMKVMYTSTWYGEAEERLAAKTLIDRGCSLISQHADSMGAPDACQSNNPKIPNVSYNVSTKEGHEETYLGHSRINWKPYYSKFIEAMYKGEKLDGEKEQNWTGTLDTGSVEYVVSDLLGDSEKTKIKEVENQLRSGETHVFDTSTFTVNDLADKYKPEELPEEGKDYEKDTNGHLTMMMGATDMYVPDTDLVATDSKGKKYINESYYRSAPSFNYIIDGIEEIKAE